VTIARIAPGRFAGYVPALAELLVDAVDDGASVGFLAALDPATAAAWWAAQEPTVTAGGTVVWVASAGPRVVGTVSLAFAAKPNARHRGEIVKLIVRRSARGRGLGRRLLATAEAGALAAGIDLLLLDTETDSPAEYLYRAAGWTRYGVVPDYASTPDGTPADCSFFFKRLGPAAAPA
jgi:GNAT superfamily N-acetyltransferase